MSKLNTNSAKRKKLAFALILIIIFLIFLALILKKPNQEEVKGFGDELYQDGDEIPETPQEFAVGSNDYIAPSGEKIFTINYQNRVSNNELIIQATSFIQKGVAYAKWSNDSQFIIFSLAEEDASNPENSDEPVVDDAGNIWIVDSTGQNKRQIIDLAEATIVDFVSNGSKIAFTTNTKVGIVNLDGTDLRYVYEYTLPETESDSHYIPTIQIVNTKFKVEIKNADDSTTSLTFDF